MGKNKQQRKGIRKRNVGLMGIVVGSSQSFCSCDLSSIYKISRLLFSTLENLITYPGVYHLTSNSAGAGLASETPGIVNIWGIYHKCF